MAKVLVVDDSSIMRRKLSTIFKNEGHTIVAEAANGELGAKEYKMHKPDLVTMDIAMPVMDGIQATKEIIRFDPDAQIIMISALDQKFMILTALRSGASHYIIKPFTKEKLISIVNEVLNSPQNKSKKKADTLQSRPPYKQQWFLGEFTNTITEISISIDDINAAIKKLEMETSDNNDK